MNNNMVLEGIFSEEHKTIILNINKITGSLCLLDSGTLLATIRDGKLFSWDHDIDITLLEQEFTLLTLNLDKLKPFCKKINVKKFHGVTIMVEIYLFNSLAIGIHRFTRLNNEFVEPNYLEKSKVIRYLNPPTFYRRGINFIERILYVKRQKNIPCIKPFSGDGVIFEIDEPKDCGDFMIFYWWAIPSIYFSQLKTILIDGIEFFIPMDVNKYLQLRYGNWTEKKTNWFYYCDDGTIKKFEDRDWIAYISQLTIK